MSSETIFRLIDKVVHEYDLVKPGDRILVGASGGKDSTLLIQYFSRLKRYYKIDFEFLALNIQSDVAPAFPENIRNLFDEWQVEFKTIDVDILKSVKEGHKMNCWWCSNQRRKELMNYAVENGYNKLSLGHHLDDVLQTLFMNAIQKCELSTMIPELKLDRYPVSIIRPLYYVCENQIIQQAKDEGYYGWTCTCNYQENSARKDARKKVDFICPDEISKMHFVKALQNRKNEYLP